MHGGAQNRRTKNIYNQFKDCSIKEIEDEIKKLEGASILTTKKIEDQITEAIEILKNIRNDLKKKR